MKVYKANIFESNRPNWFSTPSSGDGVPRGRSSRWMGKLGNFRIESELTTNSLPSNMSCNTWETVFSSFGK